MTQSRIPVYHSIIIGAGASGLFCAGSYTAPKLLLEHNKRPGVKLDITGGGKCNFTNMSVSARDYESANKHFCHNALAAFRPEDFIRILERENIPFYEKENGRLFARSASEISAMLLRRAQRANSEIRCNTEVLSVRRENGLFLVQTSAGPFCSRRLIVASGGLSYPDLGATGFAWRTARAFGLHTRQARPVLAGLHLQTRERAVCRALAGSSLNAEVRTGKHREQGPLLFTHEGISGPAVLQISLYWKEGDSVRINFLPGTDAAAFLSENKNRPLFFSKILTPLLNAKTAKVLLEDLDARASDAPKAVLLAAAKRLNGWDFVPSGTAGYTRAEATAGGADTAQFDPSTLQCKTVPGLFFIGEALDVTGRLGGYNLHWAWASAASAARALARVR